MIAKTVKSVVPDREIIVDQRSLKKNQQSDSEVVSTLIARNAIFIQKMEIANNVWNKQKTSKMLD